MLQTRIHQFQNSITKLGQENEALRKQICVLEAAVSCYSAPSSFLSHIDKTQVYSDFEVILWMVYMDYVPSFCKEVQVLGIFVTSVNIGYPVFTMVNYFFL
jgi:hypothetical protein